MEFDEVIKKRRSIRKYQAKKVELSKISQIIDAARLAPSSGNLQNWSFVVVEKQDKKNELAVAALQQFWMQNPTLIIVCSRLGNIRKHYQTRGEMLYSIQNCAAAIENMLLKAAELGLGSCWVGAFDENAAKRILKIPDEIRVQAIVTVGYSAEKNEAPPRYRLGDLTHFEQWGKSRDDSLWPIKKHTKEEKKDKKGFLGFFKKE
jgi:nitroreductase